MSSSCWAIGARIEQGERDPGVAHGEKARRLVAVAVGQQLAGERRRAPDPCRRPRRAGEGSSRRPRPWAETRAPPPRPRRARRRRPRARSARPGIRSGGERAERHHADHERRRERLDAPAADQQENGEEQRRGDGAGDEAEGGEAKDERAARIRRGRAPRAAEAKLGGREAARQGGQGGRCLDEEDRAPAERLGEGAADGRSRGRAQQRGQAPELKPVALRVGPAPRRSHQDRVRGHQQRGSAEGLHAAGDQQEPERVGQPADQRAARPNSATPASPSGRMPNARPTRSAGSSATASTTA